MNLRVVILEVAGASSEELAEVIECLGQELATRRPAPAPELNKPAITDSPADGGATPAIPEPGTPRLNTAGQTAAEPRRCKAASPKAATAPAAAPGEGSGRLRTKQPIIVEIQGKPGRFPAKEAAAKLGVAYGSITSRLCKVADGEWTNIKSHIVRRIAPGPTLELGSLELDEELTAPAKTLDAQPDDSPHETRPRRRGDIAPINPNVVGGGARIPGPRDPDPVR